mmetsp:Transcript_24984/g.25198  ORF Transcript_24984/g.25198 Transcript_24984/m.25198 type:complete len:120 (-) Transcript_24984:175-534(-)
MDNIVEISFSLNSPPKDFKINIDEQHCKEYNPNCVGEDISSTSFQYTKRHDHGSLPELKNSSRHNTFLISALQEAKYECDKFLTSEIGRISKSEKVGENAEEMSDVTELCQPLKKTKPS